MVISTRLTASPAVRNLSFVEPKAQEQAVRRRFHARRLLLFGVIAIIAGSLILFVPRGGPLQRNLVTITIDTNGVPRLGPFSLRNKTVREDVFKTLHAMGAK